MGRALARSWRGDIDDPTFRHCVGRVAPRSRLLDLGYLDGTQILPLR